MRTFLVLLLFIGAGCLSDDGPAETPDDEPDEGPDVQVYKDPVVAKGEGVIVASGGGLTSSQGGGEIVVPEDASILYVEWAWDDPVVDLDGALSSPSAGDTQGVQNIDHTAPGGSPGSPDSPHTLTIELPEPGTWSVSMTANGAAANTEYRFAATAFYGTIPEGYTAL